MTSLVIDTGCYMSHKSKGEKHTTCATACAKAGVPLALLDEASGTLYIPVARMKIGIIAASVAAFAGALWLVGSQETVKDVFSDEGEDPASLDGNPDQRARPHFSSRSKACRRYYRGATQRNCADEGLDFGSGKQALRRRTKHRSGLGLRILAD